MLADSDSDHRMPGATMLVQSSPAVLARVLAVILVTPLTALNGCPFSGSEFEMAAAEGGGGEPPSLRTPPTMGVPTMSQSRLEILEHLLWCAAA